MRRSQSLTSAMAAIDNKVWTLCRGAVKALPLRPLLGRRNSQTTMNSHPKIGSHTRVAVVGLGYVGLPLAMAFAGKYDTIGFDIDAKRVAALNAGHDSTSEVESSRLLKSNLLFTADLAEMKEADVFIVCVPTPIYSDHRPDLRSLESASRTIARVMRRGAIIVYESTVYPGLTEDFCGRILAEASGLAQGRDFKLAYSPERINPGDKEHTFERIVKVVAGEDAETAEIVASLYSTVVHAGIHIASSIKVAEAAKVLENTQRDLNIALMNEMAIICDLMGIRTRDVLDAAGTKWNFLPFSPGLVGGHCIGVDPYYLTSKAQELGYHPEVILAGRRINDSMGRYIANRAIRFLAVSGKSLINARVGVLGLTFKENVPDIRNSRVPDILAELRSYGIDSLVADPIANSDDVKSEWNISLNDVADFKNLDILILAVPHEAYVSKPKNLWSMVQHGGALLDVKSAVEPADSSRSVHYWSL